MSEKEELGKSTQSSESGKKDGSNILTPARATIIAALIAATIALVGIIINNKRIDPSPSPSPSPSQPSPTQPAPLAVEITPLTNSQDVEATISAGHNSAHFKVPVLLSGETTLPNLGIYILVFDRGIWEIQRDSMAVEASKGSHEIDAWSGGGSKENRTQAGQAIKLRAVVADIDKVTAYAPDGSKRVSEDAKEVGPVAISPKPITVYVRPIKQL
jgi:hypothetical protein